MKCAWLFLLLILPAFPVLSQEELQFDIKEEKIDLGDIEKQGGSGRFDLHFTNTGNKPLIIERASTGDGGTMADYSRDPILPGKKGTITFIYIRDYVGPKHRSITINATGEKGSFTKVIALKYRIVYPPTTIAMTPAVLETRKLNFAEADTLTFTVRNTGNNPLYLSCLYNEINKEVLVQKVQVKSDGVKQPYGQETACEPGGEMLVTIVVQNIYGVGIPVKHTIDFTYNMGQSFSIPLIIHGNGGSPTEKRVESSRMLVYRNGELMQLDEFGSGGQISNTLFFEKGICTRKITYDYRQTVTVLYTNGKEASRTVVPLETPKQ